MDEYQMPCARTPRGVLEGVGGGKGSHEEVTVEGVAEDTRGFSKVGKGGGEGRRRGLDRKGGREREVALHESRHGG